MLSLNVGATSVFYWCVGWHSSIHAPKMLTQGCPLLITPNLRNECKLEDSPFLWPFAVARATLNYFLCMGPLIEALIDKGGDMRKDQAKILKAMEATWLDTPKRWVLCGPRGHASAVLFGHVNAILFSHASAVLHICIARMCSFARHNGACTIWWRMHFMIRSLLVSSMSHRSCAGKTNTCETSLSGQMDDDLYVMDGDTSGESSRKCEYTWNRWGILTILEILTIVVTSWSYFGWCGDDKSLF